MTDIKRNIFPFNIILISTWPFYFVCMIVFREGLICYNLRQFYLSDTHANVHWPAICNSFINVKVHHLFI